MNDSSLSNIERREQIVAFIEAQHHVSAAQICEKFEINETNARRDLDFLVAQGKIQKAHGGFISTRTAPPENPLAQRMDDQSDEKKRIGKAAARLINDDETIFLGSGTTVCEVARHLTDRKNLTVITNSLLVLNTLADSPGITLICLGGIFRRNDFSLIGHITQQALAEVRVDKVVLSARAVDVEKGLTNHFLPDTMTDRAILPIGKQVILTVDHDKCGRVFSAFLAPISTVSVLVTGVETSPGFINDLKAKHIQVIQV